MEWIITAGATSEQIDTVRSITNHATGALGCLIAQKLIEREAVHGIKLHYLCESSAIKPDLPYTEIHLVHGVAETASILQELLTAHKITGVIHSMAVSDYTVCAAVDIDRLACDLDKKLQITSSISKENLRTFLLESFHDAAFLRGRKLSSSVEHMALLLQKTPKILSMVKTLAPQTCLVGFKLLDQVPYRQLVDIAYALLQKNACDFVLANDLQSIRTGQHIGYLLEPNRIVTKAAGKTAIAELVVDKLLAVVSGEKGQ